MTTTDIINELRNLATRMEDSQARPLLPANFGTAQPIAELCQEILEKYGACDLTIGIAYNPYTKAWGVEWKLYDAKTAKFHEAKTLAECLRKFESALYPPPPITDLKDANLPPLVSAF